MPDGFSFLLKFADKSCVRIWKLPKELSGLNCRGRDECKILSGNGWKKDGGGKRNPGNVQGAGGVKNASGDGGGERLLSSFVLFCPLIYSIDS